MRVFIAALGYASVFVGLPWIAAFSIFALAVRYRAWEAILLGLLTDMLWLPTGQLMLPYFTIGAVLIVWLFEPLRTQFLR